MIIDTHTHIAFEMCMRNSCIHTENEFIAFHEDQHWHGLKGSERERERGGRGKNRMKIVQNANKIE